MAQELKLWQGGPSWREFYEKSDVDAVLTEKDMEIFNLKKELSYIKEDSTFDRDKHKDLLKSKDEEIRRLQRALYKACANWAMAESYSVLNDVPTSNRWVHTLNKCREKSEAYK